MLGLQVQCDNSWRDCMNRHTVTASALWPTVVPHARANNHSTCMCTYHTLPVQSERSLSSVSDQPLSPGPGVILHVGLHAVGLHVPQHTNVPHASLATVTHSIRCNPGAAISIIRHVPTVCGCVRCKLPCNPLSTSTTSVYLNAWQLPKSTVSRCQLPLPLRKLP